MTLSFYISSSSLGVVLTFFSIKQSFILTMITYGLMFGLGVGIAYAIPMACAMRVSTYMYFRCL